MIKVRGQDRHGSGHYGAPRSGRKHSGIDIIFNQNEAVTAYEEGEITKFGYPYNPDDSKKGHLRYVEITVHGGDRHRYFYVEPLLLVGDTVERGDIIGSAQGLAEIYHGITNHYHWEVKTPDNDFRDPVAVLRALGYEVDG